MAGNLKVLGIIPARAGSKGIPHKNLAKLCGKSLLRWTVDAANSSLIDTVAISTDMKNKDERGLGWWEDYQDEDIIDRPPELCADDSPTIDTLVHAVGYMPGDYDAVFTLQPTNPLRTVEDINNAILTMETTGCDSVLSVTPVEDWLPSRMMRLDDDELLWFAKEIGCSGIIWRRRQEADGPLYLRDGSIYLTRTELIREKRLIGDNPRWIFIPRERSVRIDTPFDLEYAEWLMQRANLTATPEIPNNTSNH